VIKPGDLVKHADWDVSPVNSYRDELGFVLKYDSKKWNDTAETHRNWVVVRWLTDKDDSLNYTAIYHVNSLKRYEECE